LFDCCGTLNHDGAAEEVEISRRDFVSVQPDRISAKYAEQDFSGLIDVYDMWNER
jgi:hypothetical protein